MTKKNDAHIGQGNTPQTRPKRDASDGDSRWLAVAKKRSAIIAQPILALAILLSLLLILALPRTAGRDVLTAIAIGLVVVSLRVALGSFWRETGEEPGAVAVSVYLLLLLLLAALTVAFVLGDLEPLL